MFLCATPSRPRDRTERLEEIATSQSPYRASFFHRLAVNDILGVPLSNLIPSLLIVEKGADPRQTCHTTPFIPVLFDVYSLVYTAYL
jgi:hypothetical protein